MLYRVVVSQEVFDRLEAFVDYIAIEQQAPLNAERWLRKAWQHIQTLKTFPNRCPKAPEDKQFDFTVRMLIVDRCLFLYTVDEEKREVQVFGFRHGSQDVSL